MTVCREKDQGAVKVVSCWSAAKRTRRFHGGRARKTQSSGSLRRETETIRIWTSPEASGQKKRRDIVVFLRSRCRGEIFQRLWNEVSSMSATRRTGLGGSELQIRLNRTESGLRLGASKRNKIQGRAGNRFSFCAIPFLVRLT